MTVTQLDSPYRGLAAFGDSEDDERFFFGRERETEVTTANVLASRLSVLYGPSGVGKSSLVRAGVTRRLRELGLRRAIGQGPDLACVVFATWADDPVQALGTAIEAEVRPLVSATVLSPLPGATLADVAEHWTGVLDGDLCLVLDQFEEYFVYHEHETGDGSLLAQLPELVSRSGLRANVLLSLRDDQLARLGAFKRRIPGIFTNARRLERLDTDSARAAILGPLQQHNELVGSDGAFDIEPELVDAVLVETAVAGDVNRIEAPYLQLVMQRVWDDEVAGGSHVLRLETLRGFGGVDAIVRDHVNDALEILDADEQEVAARMFEHLVTPSGTKIAHRESDLSAFAHVGPVVGRRVLAALGRERIVRPLDDDGGPGGRYEIFHDVLGEAVLEWGHRREIEVERERASRRQRRLFVLVAAALAAVVVMIAVTVFALSQRSDARTQARRAGASALAAQALAVLPTDPQQALQLADRAARRDATVANEDVLRSALISERGRAVFTGNVNGVLAAGFSNGHVVTVDGAGTLHSYPLASGGPATSAPLGGRVRAAAVSAAGNALVVARRRLVEVRVLEGGHGFAFKTPSPVRAVAVDAHGRRVAVAMIDGRILVRDARRTLAIVRGPFRAVTVALDGAGHVVAAAGGHASRVWRVQGSKVLVRAEDAKDVSGVALTSDGTLLGTASVDGDARVRSVPGGALVAAIPTSEPLRGVAFTADGSVLVTRGRTGVARVFDVAGGHPVAVLVGHSDAVTSAAFTPDATMLVTGSTDGTARLWDPGVAPELQLVARPPGCCTGLETGKSGTVVVAGGRALLYRGGKLVSTTGTDVTAAAPSGAGVVTGDAHGTVRVGNLVLGDLGGAISGVAAANGVVAASSSRGAVGIWSHGRRVRLAERTGVKGVALSSDGTLLATAGADNIARIFNAKAGAVLHELRGHTKAVTGAAFSPDGKTLATSSADFDVRLWDVVSGRKGPVLKVHFATVSGVAFSPDGRWLVSAGPKSVGLFRMPAGTFVTFLRGHAGRIVGVGFAADGRTIESASVDGTIRSYYCRICARLPVLLRSAEARMAANR
jgi:WD40 repeat protein